MSHLCATGLNRTSYGFHRMSNVPMVYLLCPTYVPLVYIWCLIYLWGTHDVLHMYNWFTWDVPLIYLHMMSNVWYPNRPSGAPTISIFRNWFLARNKVPNFVIDFLLMLSLKNWWRLKCHYVKQKLSFLIGNKDFANLRENYYTRDCIRHHRSAVRI